MMAQVSVGRPFAWEKSYPTKIRWDHEIHTCSLGEYIVRAAHQFGDRPALDDGKTIISYRELGDRVLRAAAGFHAMDELKSGLALLLPNTPWHPICFFAAACAGLRVVQLSPMDSIRELEHKLRDSGGRVVLTIGTPDFIGKAMHFRTAGLVDKVIVANANVHDNKVDAPCPADLIALADLMNGSPLSEPVKVDPSKIAVLQYTGGTTGLPKGAALSHHNLVAAAEISAYWQTVRKVTAPGGERALIYLPLFHAFALTMLTRHLGRGNTIYLRQRFDAAAALDEMVANKINIFHGVPTMFIGMLADAQLASRDLSALTFVTSGGAPLPAQVARDFERLTGQVIHPGWGMSETGAIGCQHIPGGPIHHGSIGLPLPGIELQVVDLDERTRLVPCGQTGEIRMRAPNLFHAYWDREDERRNDFVDDYFYTGDVGYISEQGYVFLTDRRKDMILSGGFNVYPRHIEEAIFEHPDVAECIVIGIPDEYRGQVAKAFIALKPGATGFDLPALSTFLSSRLGRYEFPQAIEFRDRLPRTNVGKLSKLALQQEEAQRGASANSRSASVEK
ncbi:AMP-binding protein [Mesorhizobium abyssinicae]|uniref:AMP-binding protein n=1 Tax=Mesorhizobium abyssinicae TaxID=1209958 RepID=UPI003393005B